MFNPQRLLQYCVPDVRHRYTRRDTALYALSVGFGQDPLDRRQLDYVSLLDDMQVAPSLALVLGYPGFWLGQPDTGVTANRVVHSAQHIELAGPLEPSGEVVSHTFIESLVDRGTDKGAVLSSRRDLLDVKTGRPLASTKATHILRADGGFGGNANHIEPPHPLPERAPDQVLNINTHPAQALLYRLNGDDNPLHAFPDIARASGFERPILHGMCTFGVACRALLQCIFNFEAGMIKSMGMRFTAPVYPGDTLRVEIWNSGSFRVIVPERSVTVANNGYFAAF